ncbi:hypothetical protein F5884DRAFT_875917 [Xylogone sp. PMI_703]|nr:hypothetical protein F5884DRAFT_875917 [Xylogone sp. PMI_703]
MTNSLQLETLGNDLIRAAKTLTDHGWVTNPANPTGTNDSNSEAQQARRSIITIATRLQSLVVEPTEFIQHLASQNQLLACLQWLGEFQVLACIPLNGTVPTKDVADLAGVPEMQLCRVVRMTATAGFLQEPQPGFLAHTALSAPFVTNLSYLDATMFLAETAAPAALHMAAATQQHALLDSSNDSPYTIAFKTSQTFQSACNKRTKLQRQWSAYRWCAGDMDDSVTELLRQLNWRSLGNACIVDVCAQSTAAALALAEIYPLLHFIVQLSEPTQNDNIALDSGMAEDLSCRITIQKRTPTAPQTVKDAAVYILRPTDSSQSPWTELLAELRAHITVLRANASATLILAPRLLPEPGSVDQEVEAKARLRDLFHLQLTNQCEMELADLVEMVNAINDGRGRLVVVSKLRSQNSATVALGVKYQAYAHGLNTVEATII